MTLLSDGRRRAGLCFPWLDFIRKTCIMQVCTCALQVAALAALQREGIGLAQVMRSVVAPGCASLTGHKDVLFGVLYGIHQKPCHATPLCRERYLRPARVGCSLSYLCLAAHARPPPSRRGTAHSASTLVPVYRFGLHRAGRRRSKSAGGVRCARGVRRSRCNGVGVGGFDDRGQAAIRASRFGHSACGGFQTCCSRSTKARSA